MKALGEQILSVRGWPTPNERGGWTQVEAQGMMIMSRAEYKSDCRLSQIHAGSLSNSWSSRISISFPISKHSPLEGSLEKDNDDSRLPRKNKWQRAQEDN